MNEHIARKCRPCFASKWALVCMVLAAAASLTITETVVGTEAQKAAAVAADYQLPKGKQTTLGLYMTAKEAYEKLKTAPDEVTLIDVRTPEEYAFIGHPEMAWNIPLVFLSYHRKDGKIKYSPKMNPDFVADVQKIAGITDTLVLMCRSGDRSARAVDKLAAAGFKTVHTIIDGFEGDKVTDPESVFYGKRMRNGWKNSAPWVYDIDPEKIIIEEYDSK